MAAISKSETWDRIVQAETTGNATNVLMAIKDHIYQHPDESFNTVERRLRVEGRVTHIFAETMEQRNREGRIGAGYFADVHTGAHCKFGVRILMRSYPNLWPVIAKLSANREENLERLKNDTGIPMVPPQLAQALFSHFKSK